MSTLITLAQFVVGHLQQARNDDDLASISLCGARMIGRSKHVRACARPAVQPADKQSKEYSAKKEDSVPSRKFGPFFTHYGCYDVSQNLRYARARDQQILQGAKNEKRKDSAKAASSTGD